MQKELIVQTDDKGADIALLRDGKLMEIHHETYGGEFQVGDIYMGKIKKVMPGLNAAFVDIGYPKDAFLHYHDLGPDVPTFKKFVEDTKHNKVHTHLLSAYKFVPPIHKDGSINKVFKSGDNMVVQIMKEPISTKGPRLTSAISIPGRYVILMPFADNVSVSKKIADSEERKRLKDLIRSIKPKGFGVIIRTVSEGKSVSELDQDLRNLREKWKNIYAAIKQQKKVIYREPKRVELLLRDMFNSDFEKITVDNRELHKQLKEYVKGIEPNRKDVVTLQEPKDHTKLFYETGVNRQLQSLFGRIVNIGAGAYLVIEHTEAMHVIDVNSGSKRIRNDDQEGTALKTNLEAAAEICRQLRLRDMGGIIVIDFIDMRQSQNRQALQKAVKDYMKDDRAKHTILPLSKFGLMQITRQRVRPEKQDDNKNVCPLCKGSGVASPTLMVAQSIENRIRELAESEKGPIRLLVHPYLEAYIKKGFPSRRLKWIWEFKRNIVVQANEDIDLTHFEFQ